MRRLTLLAMVLLCIPACEDDPTDPGIEGEADGLALLVARLVVAVVPDGSETVVVQGTDGSDGAVEFTAEVGDASVASFQTTATDVTVTGLALGRTTLTLTDLDGRTLEIPVRVYDPIAADFGELRLRFWTEFGSRRGYWQADDENRYYHPDLTNAGDGWYALGSLVLRPGETLEDDAVMLIASAGSEADGASPPLARPAYYEPESFSDNGDFASRAAYYEPVPPSPPPGSNSGSDYRALGEVVRYRDDNPPEPDEVAVVRADLVHFGDVDAPYDLHLELPWNWDCDPYMNTPRDPDCLDYFRTAAEVTIIDAPPRETTYFPVGSFALYPAYAGDYSVRYQHGNEDPVVNVLELELPLLAESGEQDVIPRLTGFHAPPDQSLPVVNRAILVPFTMVSDPEYEDRGSWQVENSPFYRFERDVYWKLLYYNHNQTSITQENRVEIVSGSVESRAELFYEETGVSIRKETGIKISPSFKGASLGEYSFGSETNVSRRLGYATSTNVQELREDRTTTTVFTAPGRAAAMWQKYNRFTLKRHVGTSVEVVSVYEFGINEFVTDEFGGD